MRFEIGIFAALAAACAPLVSAAPQGETKTTEGPAGPTHAFEARQQRSSYKFTSMTTVRYATPLSSSAPVTTYMPQASMSAIMPKGAHTTTWAKNQPGIFRPFPACFDQVALTFSL